jgi:uncharacterized protein
MIRDTIKAAQITAMKAGEKDRLAAIRLILAKIKDRDIELRTSDSLPEDDTMVTKVLQKMVKQRRESITLYEQGDRPELAAIEAAELAVIEEFLPVQVQMSDAETNAAIAAIKTELGADSIKDMGRVIAMLKERHGPQLDMSKASGLVKAALI